MHFLKRDFVCERLRVKMWASYQMLRASRISLISSDDVIALLNKSRRGEKIVDFIPSDIVTADELANVTGIAPRKILSLSRRRVNHLPHYRINKQTTRFRVESSLEWLKRNARVR